MNKNNTQTKLTIFPEVLRQLQVNMNILEDELLDLEDYDFVYQSSSKVVICIIKHEDLI